MTATMTAVIPTVTFLVLASAAAITALVVRRLRGKVQSHPGDSWWQIPYDSITLLPQHKVRPHTFLVTCQGTSPRNFFSKNIARAQLTSEVSRQCSLRTCVSFLGYIDLRMLPCSPESQ